MFSTLHAGAQTNRGTRSLFLSGGCSGGGTKSLRLPPRPSLASLSISVYLSFSTTAFFPHFPLRLSRRQSPALSHSPPPPPSSLSFSTLSPRRSYSLFFLFSLRLFLCHRTTPARPCLAFASRRLFPSLSPPFFLLLPNSTTSVAFSPIPCLPPLFLFDVQTDRARERASGKIETVRRTRERERVREGKGDGIRVPYIRERAKTRRGRAGAREREAGGRRGRDPGRCAGEERWDTPRAERGRGRREAADGKARTCERDAARTGRTR